jgi:hypothetical protein
LSGNWLKSRNKNAGTGFDKEVLKIIHTLGPGFPLRYEKMLVPFPSWGEGAGLRFK